MLLKSAQHASVLSCVHGVEADLAQGATDFCLEVYSISIIVVVKMKFD